LDDPRIVVAREITKKFEEIKTNTASNLIEEFQKSKPRGEFVILLNQKLE